MSIVFSEQHPQWEAWLFIDPRGQIVYHFENDAHATMRHGPQAHEEILTLEKAQRRFPRYASKIAEALANASSMTVIDSKSPLFKLSGQERKVALLVASAKSNKEIAHILGRSESTIKETLYRARQKLGCSNRTELALLIAREGEKS